MKLFYHVVGLAGANDFAATVTQEWKWEDIESFLELEDWEMAQLKIKVQESFGKEFNVWGVPAGAPTWNQLNENESYVLLVTSIAIHDQSIKYGGIVRVILPRLQPKLSQKLWGSFHFPKIYFFKTDYLEYDWDQLNTALNYNPNYRPPNWLHAVNSDRASRLCNGRGVEEFIESIKLN